MNEETEGKKLKEKLFNKKEIAWNDLSEEKMNIIMRICCISCLVSTPSCSLTTLGVGSIARLRILRHISRKRTVSAPDRS